MMYLLEIGAALVVWTGVVSWHRRSRQRQSDARARALGLRPANVDQWAAGKEWEWP